MQYVRFARWGASNLILRIERKYFSRCPFTLWLHARAHLFMWPFVPYARVCSQCTVHCAYDFGGLYEISTQISIRRPFTFLSFFGSCFSFSLFSFVPFSFFLIDHATKIIHCEFSLYETESFERPRFFFFLLLFFSNVKYVCMEHAAGARTTMFISDGMWCVRCRVRVYGMGVCLMVRTHYFFCVRPQMFAVQICIYYL